jgi:hypothetical protein
MKLFIIMGIIVSLSSCAFSAVKRPDLTNTNKPLVSSYNISKDQATKNANTTLTILGYTPVADSDGSVVTNQVAIPVPANCDCGTWNGNVVTGTAASQFKVAFSGDARVKMDLKFSCEVTFTATNLYGVPTRSEMYQCASKGIMEQKFLSKFNEYIPAEDNYSQLEKLAKLKDDGVLTDAEFQTEKKKLLENQ